ncbi:zinc protease [Bacteroidales bacterium]|nr:zinc protease [Bacteroidales bacterium]
MTRTIIDPILGVVTFNTNIRAKRYIIKIRNGKVIVTLPPNGSYKEAAQIFHKHREILIENQEKDKTPSISREEIFDLYIIAHQTIPYRAKELAEKYNFEFQEFKISKSKTRWGSCSSSKNINLSFYLMLLPEHLIDYVILHELCHTKEMNHGEKFWALLNYYCDGKAKLLCKELKAYKIPKMEV